MERESGGNTPTLTAGHSSEVGLAGAGEVLTGAMLKYICSGRSAMGKVKTDESVRRISDKWRATHQRALRHPALVSFVSPGTLPMRGGDWPLAIGRGSGGRAKREIWSQCLARGNYSG